MVAGQHGIGAHSGDNGRVRLPIDLPVTPMLAKATGSVPDADSVPGGLVYEPKWDGFRCIVLRDGDDVELASRVEKLSRETPAEIICFDLLALDDESLMDEPFRIIYFVRILLPMFS